jgi:hypothetical protein
LLAVEKSVFKAALSDGTYHPVFMDSPVCNPPLKARLQPQCVVPYDELSHLDFELHRIVTPVADALSRLDSSVGNPEQAALIELESGIEHLKGNLACIRGISCETTDEATLQEAMLERYGEMLSGMEQAAKTIRSRETPKCAPHVHRTRKSVNWVLNLLTDVLCRL